MIAYVDSSVLLRILFGEPDPLREWDQIDQAYTSRLLLLEVSRVIDRCRHDGIIDDEEVALLHHEAQRALRSFDVLDITDAILVQAGRPMPTVVGSLDAIHLASALELAASVSPLVLATHDRQLGRAALALGLEVRGVLEELGG